MIGLCLVYVEPMEWARATEDALALGQETA